MVWGPGLLGECGYREEAPSRPQTSPVLYPGREALALRPTSAWAGVGSGSLSVRAQNLSGISLILPPSPGSQDSSLLTLPCRPLVKRQLRAITKDRGEMQKSGSQKDQDRPRSWGLHAGGGPHHPWNGENGRFPPTLIPAHQFTQTLIRRWIRVQLSK